jgi:two-component system response regulator YesN
MPEAWAGGCCPDTSRAPFTVLVVDDDRQVRGMLRRMLEAWELGLVWAGEASDGREALWRHAELRPRVVILDLWMPGLDGFAVARLLLQKDPEVQIVLFSAAVDQRVVTEARLIGIADVVSKTDSEALWSVLSELVQVQRLLSD